MAEPDLLPAISQTLHHTPAGTPPLPSGCPEYYAVPVWQVAVPTLVAAILLGALLIVGIKLCVIFYVSWNNSTMACSSIVLHAAQRHN